MAILSIQSQVLNGEVGNSAAGFILARLGHEVWPLPTTLLSHHPGHGPTEGGPVKPARLAALIEGLSQRNAFVRCDAVLSGYLGVEAAVPVVLDAIARARSANPGALYACDPVIGDAGRAYVPETLIGAFRDRLIPLADIAFPNPFELATLTGSTPRNRAGAFTAMDTLGPRIVVLTGFDGADTATGTLDILLRDGQTRYAVSAPRLGQHFSGAGDAFAAFFMARFLIDRNAPAALQAATAAESTLLETTAQLGAEDLSIIAAQAQWAGIIDRTKMPNLVPMT
ncbi:MAG TPA: pyridoxal kinase [Acidiphilium sp.]